MSKAAQRRVLEAGEWLFREGDEGDSAYLIEGGMLEVIRQADGQETVVGYLNEGEIVGEMSLIDELPRSASIRAAVGTTLRPINSEYLQSKLDSAEPVSPASVPLPPIRCVSTAPIASPLIRRERSEAEPEPERRKVA